MHLTSILFSYSHVQTDNIRLSNSFPITIILWELFSISLSTASSSTCKKYIISCSGFKFNPKLAIYSLYISRISLGFNLEQYEAYFNAWKSTALPELSLFTSIITNLPSLSKANKSSLSFTSNLSYSCPIISNSSPIISGFFLSHSSICCLSFISLS